MRFLILCLGIAIVFCEKTFFGFHYLNGLLEIGSEKAEVNGSFYYIKENNQYIYAHSGVRKNDKNPFILIATLNDSNHEANNHSMTFNCLQGSLGNATEMELKGKIKLSQVWYETTIDGSCSTTDGNKVWNINAVGIKSNKIFYEYKEAGARAKLLLDGTDGKYKTYDVISYAILDYPYVNFRCSDLFDLFPNITTDDPGYIIVGKDKAHCAIIDDTKTNFIHVIDSKVISTPISEIKTFFKDGHEYRKYPEQGFKLGLLPRFE